MLLNRRRKLLFALLFVVIASSPLVVEACRTPTKNDYDLSLSAKAGPDAILLRASLVLVRERWVHTWISQTTPMSGALISFYSCNSKGHQLRLLGSATTDKNGIASFSWSPGSAGDYWFIARFVSRDGHEHDGHS